jgi:glycosyltransferase involved in cell wall biosynthesis
MVDWPALRVVHVNDIASVASALAAAQARRGAAARVLDPPKPLAGLPYPWKVVSFLLRAVPLAATAVDLRRDRRAIVHVHYATQGVAALAAGRRYVIHCHGSDVRGARPGSLRGRLLAPILRRAALVLYATPDLEADVRPFRGDAVFLPNPIDTATFAPGGVATRDVLLASRLDPVKGAWAAIEGLEHLLRRRPATRVTVVGFGPLLGQARAVLGERVRFVPPVPHDLMPALLRDHRVVLGQFRLGILSQLELEALACGIPVVTGFHYADVYEEQPPIVLADSSDEIAARLTALLDDEEGWPARSAAGRSWVVAHHDSDQVAERLYHAYAEAGLILEQEPGAPRGGPGAEPT